MQHLLLRCLIVCSVALGFSALAHGEGSPPRSDVSNERYSELYPAIMKMRYLQQFLCEHIHPSFDTPRACLDKMLTAIDREFPDAKLYDRKITYPVFLDKKLREKQITPEVIVLAQRLTGACGYVPDLALCKEQFYTTMYSVFDTHTRYVPAKRVTEDMKLGSAGRYGGLGIPLTIRDQDGAIVVGGEPDRGTPAHAHGIRDADEIVSINGALARNFSDLTAVRDALRGDIGSVVTLVMKRVGATEVHTLTMERALIAPPLVRSSVISDGERTYGVLRVRMFEFETAHEFSEHVEALFADRSRNIDGFILRLDGNPGGDMDGAQLLLRSIAGNKTFFRVRDASGLHPYTMTRPDVSLVGAYMDSGGLLRGRPLLVMVNGLTASASEVVALVLQDHQIGVVAGVEGTFGKGVLQSANTKTEQTDGSAARVTSGEFVVGEANGIQPIQCVGVIPDIVFEHPRFRKTPREMRECSDPRAPRSFFEHQGNTRPAIKDVAPKLWNDAQMMLAAFLRSLEKSER